MDVKRRCYRVVDSILVERNVGEVKDALEVEKNNVPVLWVVDLQMMVLMGQLNTRSRELEKLITAFEVDILLKLQGRRKWEIHRHLGSSGFVVYNLFIVITLFVVAMFNFSDLGRIWVGIIAGIFTAAWAHSPIVSYTPFLNLFQYPVDYKMVGCVCMCSLNWVCRNSFGSNSFVVW